MADDNDLLSRDIKTPFATDWVYILNNAGTQEGRALLSDVLALSAGEVNTSSNAGAGAQLAKAKLGVDLPFRTLISSDATVSISQGSDEIDITTTAEANTTSNSGTGVGLAQPKVGADLPFRSLVSADDSVEFIENTDEINLKAVRVGVYRNIFITAGAMISQSTNGATAGTNATPINDIMNDFYDFPAGVDTFVQFSMAMPDEWDTTTNVGYKFYWTNGAVTGTGNIIWCLSTKAESDGEVFDTSFGTDSDVFDTYQGTADVMHITSPLIVSVGGSPALESLIYFQICRQGLNVLDNYSQDARLLGVAIQYKELTTEPAAWV